MEKKEKYTPPVIEVVLVEVENGMAASRETSTSDMVIEDL